MNFALQIFCVSILLINPFQPQCWGQQKKVEKGIASFYADSFEGRITASGETFSQNNLTAAHPTLPFNTKVKITNLSNQKQVVVRINDRGPFISNRIIDLSKAAANALGYVYAGLTKVKVEIIKLGEGSVFKTNILAAKVKKSGVLKDSLIEQKTDTLLTVGESKVQPSQRSFGVQLGSFSSKAHWELFEKNFKKTHKEPLVCQEVLIHDKKFFRAISGGFSTAQKAEAFKKTAEKHFPGCFVVYF